MDSFFLNGSCYWCIYIWLSSVLKIISPLRVLCTCCFVSFFLRRWRAKSTSNNQESFLIFFLFSLSHTILHLSFYLIKCNYRGKKLSKDKILLHSSCRQQTCYFEIVNKQNKKMAASCLLFSYSLVIEHSLFCCLSFSLSVTLHSRMYTYVDKFRFCLQTYTPAEHKIRVREQTFRTSIATYLVNFVIILQTK